MSVGYDPDRVRSLSDRTRDAIEALHALSSSDPHAAEALRAVRLVRRHLEDQWMPALIEIQRSEAMVSWTATGPLGVRWAEPRSTSSRYERMLRTWSDDELVGLVVALDRRMLSDIPPDELDAVAAELASRSVDATFADRLGELASTTPLIGVLTQRAAFPSRLVAAVVREMSWPHGPVWTVELDLYAASLSAALAALVDDPSACLDLLLDPEVMYGLATWERLDPDAVTEFVVAGLHTSVASSPDRLADGYAVLAELTALVNGPLDDRVQPAFAVGVAASMVGYVDTLAPAIRQEGVYPVLIVEPGVEVELGTYDDVVDLVGALLRDPTSQAALGTVLGEYTATVVGGLGADIVAQPGLEYVARFTDLIADASRTEQAELVAEAAVEQARRRQMGAAIGFGVTAVLAATGVGSIGRAVVSRAIAVATTWAARVDPERLPDSQIPSATYDLVTVEALRVVAADRGERRRAGLAGVDRSSWVELRRRLAKIDALVSVDDRAERTRLVLQLNRWIESDVAPLAAYLGSIRSVPGMDELTEARTAVNPD
jgi:hypothetical protein